MRKRAYVDFFLIYDGVISAENAIQAARLTATDHGGISNIGVYPFFRARKRLGVGANRGSWPRRAMSPSLTTVFLPVRTRTVSFVCPPFVFSTRLFLPATHTLPSPLPLPPPPRNIPFEIGRNERYLHVNVRQRVDSYVSIDFD